MSGSIGQWRILAPAGLTQTGRIRRFQNRTVERLRNMAEQQAAETFQQLLQAVEAAYTEGSGEVAASLQYQVVADRDGVTVNFIAGTKHIVFLTALAGGGGFNPAGHVIRAKRGRMLRFFWKNPTGGGAPGVYAFRSVHWRTRLGEDVIASVLSAGAQQFQRSMIATHDAALVDFVQNDLQLDTRSTRVGVTGGTGIPPQ